ncbi:hypothetical protein AB0I39_29120, partial [Kitasatospora purpeofusca]|uniref:hypothetical protein n=1 Tax=Kitasatospora purpeofusca TaxID=67352 RepID=UPI0033F6D087
LRTALAAGEDDRIIYDLDGIESQYDAMRPCGGVGAGRGVRCGGQRRRSGPCRWSDQCWW